MKWPLGAKLKGARMNARRWRVDPGRTSGPHSARALLLLGALGTAVFSGGNGFPLVSVAALCACGVTVGYALLAAPSGPGEVRLARVEWAIVVSLMTAGLVLTAAGLAPAFVDWPWPARWAILLGYVALGMTAAVVTFGRKRMFAWAIFGLFLTVHVAMTVALFRASPARGDVEVWQDEGARTLLGGGNPYLSTIPNFYPMDVALQIYGPDIVFDGQVQWGFPYLPFSLFAAIPGHLLGDVRYTQLIAMVVTSVALFALAQDRVGRAASVIGVAAVTGVTMMGGAFTEPTSVALLACLILALVRARHVVAAVCLGLLLVSKQYFLMAVPLLWIIRDVLTRRMIVIALAVAAAVTLPLVLVDAPAFWENVALIHARVPLRADSVTLTVSSVTAFGWPPEWLVGLLPLLGGGITALVLAWRAPRTPAALAAAVGLTLLVTVLLSKQAFGNYYYLVSCAFLIGAVAWPSSPHEAGIPLGPPRPEVSHKGSV